MHYHRDMEIVAVTTAAPTRIDEANVASWLISKRSERTRAAYRRDFRDFAAFAAAAGTAVDQATTDHVNAWARSMTASGAAPSSVNRRLTSLSSYYKHQVLHGRLETNPADSGRVSREQKSPGKPAAALTTDEVKALRAAAAKAGDRDRLLVDVLLHTGMRVAELCSANVGDIESQRGHCVLSVHGKGNKMRAIVIPAAVCDQLNEHNRPADEPLILDNDGGRLNRHQVTRILARLRTAAGIETKITPHVLRATAITEALDGGAPLWVVQDHAGHSDPRTTRAYQRRAAALEMSPTYTLAARWA